MNKFVSRKFLLTLVFAGIVCYNAWGVGGVAIGWEELIALAVMFGIYGGANVADKVTNAGAEPQFFVYDNTTEDDGDDA